MDLGQSSAQGNNASQDQQQSTPQQRVEAALKRFVQLMSGQSKPQTLRLLRRLLEASVAKRAASARQVCDLLLSCDNLTPSNGPFWLASFALVRRVVGGVDYKGVREIMRTCIEKVLALPVNVSPVINEQVQ